MVQPTSSLPADGEQAEAPPTSVKPRQAPKQQTPAAHMTLPLTES